MDDTRVPSEDMMKSSLFHNFKRSLSGMFPPVSDVGKLGVAACEKLVEHQIESMQYYSRLGIDHMKAAVAVNDYDSAQSFFVRNIELIGRVGKRLVDDSREVVEISKSLGAEIKTASELTRQPDARSLKLAHQEHKPASKQVVKKLAAGSGK